MTNDRRISGRVTRTNAARIAARLRISPDKDLRGLDLSREDLSFRNLQQLDFTGANMTETRLTGAVLDQAVLRGVRLVGAQLDQASLVGTDLRGADMTEVQLTSANLQNADLRGTRLHRAHLDQASLVRANLGRADLTGARLARTDFTGARGEGSRWTRAALLDVIGSPIGTELAGSGRVPGTPPLTEFAPAAIGVKHGVDAQSGRLPRPLAYSPDGGTVAVGCDSGSVVVYGADTGRTLRTLHGHRARTFAVAYTEQVLVTGSADGTVRIGDAAGGAVRKILSGHENWPWPLETDSAGTLLAGCGNNGSVRLWDAATGRLTQRLQGSADGLITLESGVFSPAHPAQLVTVGNAGRLRVFDIDAATAERDITVDSAPVWAIAYDPAARYIATANDDDTVTLWTRETGGEHAVCAEHRGRVRSIAFDAAGATMATGCDDGHVRLWDVASGDLLETLSDPVRDGASGHRVYGVVFRGDRLAGISWDGTVRIWSLTGGPPLHRLDLHRGRLWCVAVDPVSGTLATAGDDLVINLWDITSGRHLHTLYGHRNRVRSLAFAPSGRLLASAGNDGSIMLWSLTDPAAAPQPRGTLLGLPEGWVAFTPDGRYKTEGLTAGQFWHVIGLCRFEAGELDPYLPQIRQMELDDPL
ncbi:pentapeptide repeat-containing protein [Nocardia sp. NPDC059228]|uniref:WD40 repeat domain-containing protein n=1 Tax=Nocardia sp. NPDC059228 TaxID=3346777 RepID=UPI0036B9653B